MVISLPSLSGQYQGTYISNADSSTYLNINKDIIEIYQVEDYFRVEDILERSLILKSEYDIVSDTIFLTRNNARIYFLILNEEILQLKGDLKHFISCNTMFYCTRKKDANGEIVYFGKWKNGKKDGVWLYISQTGIRIKVTYEKGVVLDRTVLD